MVDDNAFYQRWAIAKNNKSGTLKFSGECRKLRIIFLKSIFDLLYDAELSSRNAISNQAIRSIQHCVNWLAQCFKALQESEDLTEYKAKTPQMEFGSSNANIGRKYVGSLKQLVNSYNNYKRSRPPREKRIKTKKIFQNILIENIESLKLAIQILAHFKIKRKKHLLKPKKQNRKLIAIKKPSKTNEIKPIETNEQTEPETKQIVATNTNENTRGVIIESTLPKIKESNKFSISKSTNTSNHSIYDPIQFNKTIRRQIYDPEKSEVIPIKSLAPSIASVRKHLMKGPMDVSSLKSVAHTLIQNLFASKAAPFELINEKEEPEGPDNEFKKVWRALVVEHNHMMYFPGKRNLMQIKDDLASYYSKIMQLSLKNQINASIEAENRKKIDIRKTKLVHYNNIANKSLEANEAYHKLIYNLHVKKLMNARQNSSIQKMLNMVMSDTLPQTQSGQDLIKKYERNPEFYNILLMSSDHNIGHSDDSLLKFIESRFEYMKDETARQRRRLWLQQTSANLSPSSVFGHSEDRPLPISYKNNFVLDDEYCKKVREKWTKYFAEQEKTPLMLHLEEVRQEKLALAAQRKAERKLKKIEEAKNQRKMRPITALYTSPRVTHRMRQAIERLAEESLVPPTQYEAEQELNASTSVISIEEIDNEAAIADIILDSQDVTSCCSKCRSQSDCGSVLKRFFQTHDEIINEGNKLDNLSDFKDATFC